MRRSQLIMFLFLAVTFPAFAAPTTGPSLADYRQDLNEVLAARLFERASIAGKPWEELAQKLCTMTIQAMADQRVEPLSWPDHRPDPGAMADLADQLIAAGCDEPVVLFCCMRAYTRAWREEDARKLIPRLKDIGTRQLPALVIYSFRDEMNIVGTERAVWTEAIRERTAALNGIVNNSNTLVNDSQLRYVLQLIYEDALRRAPGTELKASLERASRNNRAHPWIREMLLADLARTAAWDARGSETIDQVKPESLEQFNTHLATAKGHYTKAAELKPGLPESWAGLITIALATGQPHADLLDRGLSAEIDSRGIYEALQWGLRPRWGGSHELMLAAGQRAIDTQRYDTQAPFRYVEMVNAVDEDQRSIGTQPPIWRNPAVRNRAMGVFAEYTRTQGTGDRASRFAAAWLEGAIQSEQFEEANLAAQRMKPIDPSRSVDASMAHAMTGTQLVPLTGIRPMLNEARWKDAAAALNEVLGAMEPTDPGRLYVQHAQLVAQRQLTFESGEWTDLAPQEHFLGWRARGGDWRWIGGRASAAATDQAIHGMSHVRLRGRLELTAKLEFNRPTGEPSAAAGVVLQSHEDPQALVYVMLSPAAGRLRVGTSADAQEIEVPSGTAFDVRIVLDDPGVTVTCGNISRTFGDPAVVSRLLNTWLWPSIRQQDSGNPPLMRVSLIEFRARQIKPAELNPPLVTKDTPSQRTYASELAKLFEAALLERAALSGTAWEASGRKLIERTALAMADDRIAQLAWSDNHPSVQELTQLADEVLNAGCTDPSVLFCCMRALSRSWRDTEARSVALKLKEVTLSQVPALVDYYLQCELAALETSLDAQGRIDGERTQAAWAIVRGTGGTGEVPDALLRLALEITLINDNHYYNLEAGKTILDQTLQLPDVHPWIGAMLRGVQNREYAWHVRGSGWANQVAPEAWPVFHRHMQAAGAYYGQASRLKPHLPESWAGLVEVAMAEGKSIETPFAHGMAAEVDHPHLWRNVLWGLRPRWGGTYEAMLAVGQKGLATDRYDTLAPYEYVIAARDVADDARTWGVAQGPWQDPRVDQTIVQVLNRYVFESGPSPRSARFLTRLLEKSLETRRYEDARAAAERLAAYREFQVNMVPLLFSRAHASNSQHRTDIDEAQRLLADHSLEGARSIAAKVLSEMDVNDPGRPAVEQIRQTAEARIRFETGEWIDLTPTQDLALWYLSRGDFRWIDGVMHAAASDQPFYAFSNVLVQGPLEVVAKLEFPRPTSEAEATAAIGLVALGSGGTAATHYSPLFGQLQGVSHDDQRIVQKGLPQTTVELQLRVTPQGVFAGTAGNIQKLGDEKTVEPLLGRWLRLTIAQSRVTPMRVIVREFRVRKLPANG